MTAGSSPAATVTHAAPCPCGGGGAFGACCGPLLAGEVAPSPERLMRSRYTAFVLRDGAYLHETWHPGTRPERVEPDADTRWVGLEILAVEGGEPGSTRGFVEFAASYRMPGVGGVQVQRERSRFVRQSGRWWYLDGTIEAD